MQGDKFIYRGFNIEETPRGTFKFEVEPDKWEVGWINILTGESHDFESLEECQEAIDHRKKSAASHS